MKNRSPHYSHYLWPPAADYPDDNPKSIEGRKKTPLHLIPPAAKIECAAAMALGERKYGAYNWRGKSVAVSVYVAALQRHADAYWGGEDTDPETGVHHLGSVMACAAILLDALHFGNFIDDRPPSGGDDPKDTTRDGEYDDPEGNTRLSICDDESWTFHSSKQR